MSYTLIKGPAKSGKTTFCLNKIEGLKNSGKNIIMIIPEQISLLTENKVIEKIGYLGRGIDVLSFERLFYRLYKIKNGKQRSYVTNVGKSVIVNRILAKNSKDLAVYKAGGNDTLITSQILATLKEFKRHSVSPDDVFEASKLINSGITSLKLKDLHKIYSLYNEELEKFGFDADDNVSLLPGLIDGADFVENSVFLIDGFSSFTKGELNAVKALCQTAHSLYITLSEEENDSFLFEPVLKTEKALKEILGEPEKNVILKETYVKSKELKFLFENFARYNKKTYEGNVKDIMTASSESPFEEVDMIARSIIKLTKKGMLYKEIGILCPSIREYSYIIEKAFNKHNINFYINEKKTLSTNCISRLFTSLFDVFIKQFTVESVFGFLKNPFINNNYDILENYVIDNGIKGKGNWTKEFTYKSERYNLIEINKKREEFLSIVMPFREKTQGKTKCTEYVNAVFDFIERINLEKKINDVIKSFQNKGMVKEALEYKQTFEKTVNILEQFAISSEDESFGIEKLSSMFRSALLESKISTIPPTVDSVLIASLDEMRHQDFKVLYVIGANLGAFPETPSGTGILTDSERKQLKANKIDLALDLKEKALEQPFKIYELLTVPKEKLIVSYTLSDSKREAVRPSSVISDIKSLFPNLPEYSTINIKKEIDLVSTPKATLTQLAKYEKNEIFRQVERWYLENEEWSKKYKYILSAKKYSTFSGISPEISEKLWGHSLNMTVSRLEAYAKCPFSYFMTYGLELKKRDVRELASFDAGNYLHKILENYFNYCVENNIDLKKVTKEECFSKVSEVSKEAYNDFVSKTPLHTKRHDFLLERMKEATKNTVWAITNHIRAGDFIPYETELEIGKNPEVSPITLTTDNGNKITLYGKIDRVDLTKGGYRIIDYKSSNHSIDISDVANGLSMQLFVYCNTLKDKFGKPKGMFYLTVKNPSVNASAGKSNEDIAKEIQEQYRLSGYIIGDKNTVLEMDRGIAGKSSVIPAKLKNDGNPDVYTKIISEAQFNAISEKMFDKVKEYGDRIINGDTRVSPYRVDDTTNSCTYCDYASVCGFDTDKKFRKIRKTTLEEITGEGGNNNE